MIKSISKSKWKLVSYQNTQSFELICGLGHLSAKKSGGGFGKNKFFMLGNGMLFKIVGIENWVEVESSPRHPFGQTFHTKRVLV